MQQRRVGGVPNSPFVLSFLGSRFLFDLWSHEATVLRVPLVSWYSIVPRLGISMSTLDGAGSERPRLLRPRLNWDEVLVMG